MLFGRAKRSIDKALVAKLTKHSVLTTVFKETIMAPTRAIQADPIRRPMVLINAAVPEIDDHHTLLRVTVVRRLRNGLACLERWLDLGEAQSSVADHARPSDRRHRRAGRLRGIQPEVRTALMIAQAGGRL